MTNTGKMLAVAPLVLLLTACAQSSGVMKLGPDTYTVSVHAAPARGGDAGATRIALSQANEECRSQGKEILVTNMSSGASYLPGGKAEITFQCLDQSDPGLYRPNYERSPDIMVEHQN